MFKKYSFFLMAVVFALLVISGCGKQSVRTEGEYLKWLENEENGVVKTKYVNGLEIKIKYLPAEYLAYQEMSKETSVTKGKIDSVINLYKNGMTFLMTIGPDERNGKTGGDVMYRSVTSYSEYAQRVFTMNFDMEPLIELHAGANNYKSVLSSMENIYSLSPKRNILFVFAPLDKQDKSLITSATMDFVYDDQLFDLGTNHFLFNRNAINSVPKIIFWNS